MRRLLAGLALVVFAAAAASAPLRAQDHAGLLMEKLAGADPGLESYRADVAFEVGLHSFPYVRKTLHGNAYFKRPAKMELVFSDLPAFARAFRNVYVGLGTPADWQKKFTIGAAEETAGGRTVSYLVLTPRSADRRLREVDVYVDDAAALPERIVWQYRDGRIDMHQRFDRIAGHAVVVAQDADIRLPAVHAYVAARVSNYALNVDVSDSVFTPKIAATPQP